MRAYTIFDTTTGLPLRQGFVPHYAFANAAGPGEIAVEGNLGNAYYWDSVDEMAKPRAALAASVSAFTLNLGQVVSILSLPIEPITVVIDGTPVVVNDGFLDFTPSDPGYYHIQINEKLYQYQLWTFHVIDTTPVPF